MILGFLTKYRDYRARVHTGTGGDTGTSYIMTKKLDFDLEKLEFQARSHHYLNLFTFVDIHHILQ